MSAREHVMRRSRTTTAVPADRAAHRPSRCTRLGVTSSAPTRPDEADAFAAIDRWNNEGGSVYDAKADTSPPARRATALRGIEGGAA